MKHWEFGPILRALKRNKVGALLIMLQIAVTMTIIVNGIFIIGERNTLMARESGVDEANSFHLLSYGYSADFNMDASIRADLDLIRGTVGVKNAVTINAIPISGGGWSMGLQTEPGAEHDATGVAIYMVDEQGLDTLDVALVAGENFTASDIRWRVPTTEGWPSLNIITIAMAEALFPDIPYEQVVGKTVYIDDDKPMIIKGIIDHLQAPWIGWDGLNRVMLSPEYLSSSSTGQVRYFIRTEPGLREQLMVELEETLATSQTGRIIRGVESMEETRTESYRNHAGIVGLLVAIMTVLTIVTALGIVGLANFSVNRRTKQIGTRRALGATKGAIMRYFLLENFMISTVGVVLGALLTVGLNIALVEFFALNRIDWYYVPVGMAALYIVGQLAVFGPARRAASISPAIATRTA